MIPNYIDDQVSDLSNDLISGSSKLAAQAIKCIEEMNAREKFTSPKQLWERFYELGKKLVHAQPDMVAIFRVVDHILMHLREYVKEEMGVEEIQGKMHNLIEEYQRVIRLHFDEMVDHAVKQLNDQEVIITHSNSGSVYQVLTEAHAMGKKIEVIISESRPNMEGKDRALALAKQGIKTTLVTDCALLLYLERCTKVLLGADRMTHEYFVNKVGSLALALGSREFEKPLILVMQRFKFLPYIYFNPNQKVHAKEEVSKEKHACLTTENAYFESIPLSYVKQIVCEEGVFTPKKFIAIDPDLYFPNLLKVE